MKINSKLKKMSIGQLYDEYLDILYMCKCQKDAKMFEYEIELRLGKNLAFAACNYIKYRAEQEKADDILISLVDTSDVKQLYLLPDSLNKFDAISRCFRDKRKEQEKENPEKINSYKVF